MCRVRESFRPISIFIIVCQGGIAPIGFNFLWLFYCKFLCFMIQYECEKGVIMVKKQSKIPEGAKVIDEIMDFDMSAAKVIDADTLSIDKIGIPDDEEMYEKATSQCNVLRVVLQNPQCSDETRKSVVDIIKNILNSFGNGSDIKKMKEQIYLENPDFFPKEAELIKAKIKVRENAEQRKSEIKERLKSKKPEDRISGVVASDILVEGIKLGLIDKPKDVESANRQNKNIRKRLGMRLLQKKQNE